MSFLLTLLSSDNLNRSANKPRVLFLNGYAGYLYKKLNTITIDDEWKSDRVNAQMKFTLGKQNEKKE